MSRQSPTPFEEAARRPAAASQATAIEQSRAIAEVQGAIVLAQQRPRDMRRAEEDMERSCKVPALAERAFFSFPRGGQTVSGPTVHLARELARSWGNIVYGIKELDRDDPRMRSEMLAFAWDLETNARSELTFIVPHKRDKSGGPEVLTDLRDIYENNTNNGARRLRECIFAVLPVWLIERAKQACHDTLKQIDSDKKISDRIADCLAAFGKIGISEAQLAAKIGRPPKEFNPDDLARLRVVLTSLRRNETTKDEEFPPPAKNPTEGDAFERAQRGESATTEKRKTPAKDGTGEQPQGERPDPDAGERRVVAGAAEQPKPTAQPDRQPEPEAPGPEPRSPLLARSADKVKAWQEWISWAKRMARWADTTTWEKFLTDWPAELERLAEQYPDDRQELDVLRDATTNRGREAAQ